MSRFATAPCSNALVAIPAEGTYVIDALLIYAAPAFALGFAIAWALGGKTREQLAATKARADEQAHAAAEKLDLAANAKSELANAFKALSAEALSTSTKLLAARDRISSESSKSARRRPRGARRKRSTRSCSRSESR